MKNGVGGTPQRHIHGQRVEKRLFGHDGFCRYLVFYEFEDFSSRLFCQTDPGGHDRWYGAVSGKPHPDRFGQTIHGIGRKHARARPARGAGGIFVFCELIFGHRSGTYRANAFKHRYEVYLFGVRAAAIGVSSGEHGTAADKDGGQIQPRGGHQHSGDDLIAVRDHNQGIEGMADGHDFDGIGNKLAACERVFHPRVVHGDTVTDADGRKFHGCAAGHVDTRLYGVCDFIQVDMTGYDAVYRIGDTDDRLFDFRVRIPHGFEQAAVGRSFDSLFDDIAFHDWHLLKKKSVINSGLITDFMFVSVLT